MLLSLLIKRWNQFTNCFEKLKILDIYILRENQLAEMNIYLIMTWDLVWYSLIGLVDKILLFLIFGEKNIVSLSVGQGISVEYKNRKLWVFLGC